MTSPVTIDDWRTLARQRLPRILFDYLDGGAGTEAGLRRNREAFDKLPLLPDRLRDVAARRIDIELLGRRIAAPLVIAPMGLNGLLWPQGDVVLARAAARAGIPFTLSTASNAALEQVAEAAGGNLWFQLYVLDRNLADRLVARALAAGYQTLVLTVDVPVNGRRERDLRNGFALPFRRTPRLVLDVLRHPRWALDAARHGIPGMGNLVADAEADPAAQAALLARRMDASFDWDDLARLREAWPHRLVVKGLLHAEDARRCLAHGADGVVLSNHGGRQLEDLPSALDALPATVAATEAPVLADGGVRRGADVIKALALGARAVLLGRAMLYGLAAAGEEGATAVLNMILEDIDRTLALIGCPSVRELEPRHVGQPALVRGALRAAE